MKNFLTWVAVGLGYGIGIMGGYWVWSNVIEDKVEDLTDRLTKKEAETE